MICGSRTSPGGENGNPLQYSCPENSMDRGAWRATVHGVAKSQTWLNTHRVPQSQQDWDTGLLTSFNFTSFKALSPNAFTLGVRPSTYIFWVGKQGGIQKDSIWFVFRPHVIVHSLPTMRGMRCSKLFKYRFLWAVKRLIRNCIGEGFSFVGPMFAAKSPHPLPLYTLMNITSI